LSLDEEINIIETNMHNYKIMDKDVIPNNFDIAS